MAPRRGGGGGLSRRAALALIGGGGLLGISSTGAFDQVRGKRPFDLSVDDDNALLRATLLSETIEVSESDVTVELLELQNRFADSDIESIEVTDDGSVLTVESLEQATLQPGESRRVEGTVSANESTTEEITLTITASTIDERIETERDITINVDLGSQLDACPVSPIIDVTVGGNAESSKDENGDIDIGQEDEIDGYVEAKGDGDIEIKQGATISGDVEARSGAITIKGGVQIGGNVIAGGDVTIGQDAEIGGNVKNRVGSNADIDIGENGEISGDVVPDGSYGIESSVTIDGNDPRPQSGG